MTYLLLICAAAVIVFILLGVVLVDGLTTQSRTLWKRNAAPTEKLHRQQRILRQVCGAMRAWGADEDGIPDDYWDIYCEARALAGLAPRQCPEAL